MGKTFNYKKYYSEYYGIEIPTGYDIHHIDGNRRNNDIQNLLLLPSKLHHKYHMSRRFIENFDTKIDLQHCYSYNAQMATRFLEALAEIEPWVEEKNYSDYERWRKHSE